MSSFLEYYNDLQRREGLTPRTLIAPWPPEIQNAIAEGFRQAVFAAGIIGVSAPIPPGSSNQSIGNKIEKFFIE